MPEKKTYLQRVTEFSKAVRDQNAYEKLRFDDAKDFCDFLVPVLDNLPRFVNSYAELGDASAACVEEHLAGQDYRDFMEPRHRACEDARDFARTGIGQLNRFFTAMGMEPFADIDLNDNLAVAGVCGQVMLEHVGKLGEYEAQLQGSLGQPAKGDDCLHAASEEARANPGSAYASMRRYLDAADGTGGSSGVTGPEVS